MRYPKDKKKPVFTRKQDNKSINEESATAKLNTQTMCADSSFKIKL